MAENTSKNRKSETQEIFEQAENAGRFTGSDTDSKAARQQAEENITDDAQSSREERGRNDNTDTEARKDPAQIHDYKGESQNVNDDTGRPLTEDETKRATNKANEGLKQRRSDS